MNVGNTGSRYGIDPVCFTTKVVLSANITTGWQVLPLGSGRG
jgi:hypothetical protein